MGPRLPRPAFAAVAGAILGFFGVAVALGAAPIGSPIAVSEHSCAITRGGALQCWGDNANGQLGDGTTTASARPVAVRGFAAGVTAIAAGDRYTCALTTAGGVSCWGYNEFGQLGNGTTSDSASPVDVTGLANGISAIAARGEHTCALTVAGGVKCWGANINGQLGDGSTTNSPTPVDVVGLATGIIAITTGGEHTCALRTDGAVKCWGWNAAGQLGDGTTTDRSSPVDAGRPTSPHGDAPRSFKVRSIAAGGRHTCAVTIEGDVWCWGRNDEGQLGDGTTVSRGTPDYSQLGSEASAVSNGGNYTCALARAGGVQCWGDNSAGQLGNSGAIEGSPLVAVAGLGSGVTAIAAGYYHSCAVTTDGGVKCWGLNDSGQLGDGTTTDRSIPVPVGNADGTPLIVAGVGDAQGPNLLLIGVVVAAGGAVILAAGWLVRGFRRRS
jgi:alpha-tubulin suppressor-like RCC1 family protein